MGGSHCDRARPKSERHGLGDVPPARSFDVPLVDSVARQFQRGIATNVGGELPPHKGTPESCAPAAQGRVSIFTGVDDLALESLMLIDVVLGFRFGNTARCALLQS